jgi:hypothetical protein
VVHAHRDLHPHRLHPLVVGEQPAPDRPGNHREDDVVDRHGAPRGVLDPLEVRDAAGREGQLAVAADAPIEGAVGAERPKLASQRTRKRRQLAPGLPPAPR